VRAGRIASDEAALAAKAVTHAYRQEKAALLIEHGLCSQCEMRWRAPGYRMCRFCLERYRTIWRFQSKRAQQKASVAV